MDITCISDLHGYLPKLPGGDLLIVAGDLTAGDIQKQLDKFDDWLHSQKYVKKVFIAGNHDNLLIDEKPKKYELTVGKKTTEKFEYLCDSGTEFEGLKIWGSPWSLTFPNINPDCTAFTSSQDGELSQFWDKIPNDVDILITHIPPYGILDEVRRPWTHLQDNCGSGTLRCHLSTRINPRLHVFGHIHEHGGKKIILKRAGEGDENNTICVNASHVDRIYEPVHGYVRVKL